MTSPATKRRNNGPNARTAALATSMLILSGCMHDRLDLEAAREELNPLSVQHVIDLRTGTRQQAIQSGRNLISTLDCILDNPECPE